MPINEFPISHYGTHFLTKNYSVSILKNALSFILIFSLAEKVIRFLWRSEFFKYSISQESVHHFKILSHQFNLFILTSMLLHSVFPLSSPEIRRRFQLFIYLTNAPFFTLFTQENVTRLHPFPFTPEKTQCDRAPKSRPCALTQIARYRPFALMAFLINLHLFSLILSSNNGSY